MSRTFTFRRDPHEEKDYLYTKKSVEINPGVTVLVGCNGCGKTTFLDIVKKDLDKNEIVYKAFNNLTDGKSNMMQKAVMQQRFDLVSSLMSGSEGENIVTCIGEIAGQIGYLAYHKAKGEIWILFDATDSGLSIDNICEVKEYLFDTVIKDCNSRNIEAYILVSANEYEMASGENCLDVQHMKYVTFKDYDDYRSFILKSRKQKDKRFKD